MPYCEVCKDKIVPEDVKIRDEDKKKYKIEKMCVWCGIDVMQGRLDPETLSEIK